MTIPENLKYTEDHEWIRVEGELLVLGITDFAQKELGDVVYVDVEDAVGEEFSQGDSFGSVEAVKTVSDLFMPVNGTVVAINEALEDAPELVNEDPYNAGWMVKVQPANLAELDGLLNAAAYTSLITV